MHTPKRTIRIGDDDLHDDLDTAIRRESQKRTVKVNLGDLLGAELNEHIEDMKDAFKGAKEEYRQSAKEVGREIKDGINKFGEALKQAVEEAAAEEQRRIELEKGMSREVALAWGLVIGALLMWFLHANWTHLMGFFAPKRGRNFAYETLDGGRAGMSANANAFGPERARMEAEMAARRAARVAAAEEKQRQVSAVTAEAAGVEGPSDSAAGAAAVGPGLTQPRARPSAPSAADAREAARRAFLERQQALMDEANRKAQEKKVARAVE